MSKKFRNVEMLKSKPFFESVSRKVYGTHSFRLFNHPNPVLEKDHVLRSEEEPSQGEEEPPAYGSFVGFCCSQEDGSVVTWTNRSRSSFLLNFSKVSKIENLKK